MRWSECCVVLGWLVTACGGATTAAAPAAAPTQEVTGEPASGSEAEQAHPPASEAHADGHGQGHGHVHAHEHGPLVHRFEHADDWVAQFDDPARDAWQKPAEVVRALELDPGMTVADIGAGTGYFEPHLSRAVGPTGKVLALDIEPDMVRYLSERSERERLDNVQAVVAQTDDPKLAEQSVDRVLIVDTWHHIPDRRSYAQRLMAALKPGGRVYVVDYTKEASHGPPAHHRIAPEQVVQELSQAGLRAEVMSLALPEQYVVVATLP